MTFAGLTKRDGSFIVSREPIDDFKLEDLVGKYMKGNLWESVTGEMIMGEIFEITAATATSITGHLLYVGVCICFFISISRDLLFY